MNKRDTLILASIFILIGLIMIFDSIFLKIISINRIWETITGIVIILITIWFYTHV